MFSLFVVREGLTPPIQKPLEAAKPETEPEDTIRVQCEVKALTREAELSDKTRNGLSERIERMEDMPRRIASEMRQAVDSSPANYGELRNRMLALANSLESGATVVEPTERSREMQKCFAFTESLGASLSETLIEREEVS